MTSSTPLYRDAAAPLHDRIEDLLSRMTLTEKVAQVRGVSLRDSVAAEEGGVVQAVRNGITHGIGQIENTFDQLPPEQSVKEINDLQRILREDTRLGIPALVGSECAHGHAATGSTIFPVPLAMACSWNTELIRESFDTIAREARLRGNHEAHTPLLDLGRDPRWGRIEETFGEDTHLVSELGLAAVTGLQGGSDGEIDDAHLISAPKHFAGYGQVAGGRNFAATPIDEQSLQDEILPPFKRIVAEAKVQGMMASHCDVWGIPAHANRPLLTGLLRDDWGFEGYTVSDYNDIPRLEFFQRVAASPEDAAALAIKAGMDMDLPVGAGYENLERAIAADPSLEAHLDTSVRRILRLKFRLGLFENPYVDEAAVTPFVGRPENIALAEKVATESIVLLKNDGPLLPLDRKRANSIAVIGPNATSNEIGNYTVPYDDAVTLLDGIRSAAGDPDRVAHAPGCTIPSVDWDGTQSVLTAKPLEAELPEIEAAVALAARSEVAILCLGGNVQTSREAYFVDGIKGDRATLGLLGNQAELARRVIATGTPTIVILMGGRPFSLPEIERDATAILNTFYLGQCNGTAVSKILFGDATPSGKLCVTIPRSVGQIPAYYSQKRISFYKDYLDEVPGPLYPFGFGLSYTNFQYGPLQLEKTEFASDEEIPFRIEITNAGDRSGAEIVQVYASDLVASVVRPEKLLVRFAKLTLAPGESRTLHFRLVPHADLSFTGGDMKRTLEPGEFRLAAGASSTDLRSEAAFTLQTTPRERQKP